MNVELVQETDRAYLLKYEGHEVWYPKRAVLEIRVSGKNWEVVTSTDFWMFKLEQQVE